MHPGHHHSPPTATVRPDGGVVVPWALVGPLRAVLGRWLADAADTAGAAPSPPLRDLLWALAEAERQPATRPTFDDEPASATSPKLLIDTSSAAAALGCTQQHVTRLCRAGRFGCHQLGRAWLIDKTSFDEYRFRRRATR